MNRFKFLTAFVATSLIAGLASAQCGNQRVVDPTNAFLGSGAGVDVRVQGGGCANGQCNAGVSTSASVSALSAQVRDLNARIARLQSQRTDVRVYAAPARIASYQAYDVGGGGGASASSAAGSASSSASASAPRSTRALYVVPSSVYAMEDAGAAASSSASAAVDVAPSIALVPLNATDVQVAAGGGCGGGGRIRGLFRGRSRSRSVSVSVARN